jgi:ubiquinone/menaquinone biosynthesis C-methylase UbiE
MTINFHDKKNKLTYATREADFSWKELIKQYMNRDYITALDIGCGGGIYSKALSQMGVRNVIGMDFSESNLDGARENCESFSNIKFIQGDALNTGLSDNYVDLILERALIHHIKDLNSCFLEASRIIKPDGMFIIQDRTPNDCLLPGSETHIRGYFFEKYSKLTVKETERRHSSKHVIDNLVKNNFEIINELPFWEARRTYKDFTELEDDLRKRIGRSILHELSDEEISELVRYIKVKLDNKRNNEIKESDRWTIWIARRKA